MCREMKDSGIQWIGKIPQGWKLIKYKYFARSGMGETILSERLSDDGVQVYSATQSDKVFGHLKNPNLILKRGDLVIPARGNSIGCVSIIKDEIATCTQTTIYSRIDGISREYLYYCCNGLKDNWFEFDNTAIPQITVKQVQNNIVPVPEEYEQIKIANYLDKKVSQIDDIILKQKNLIEKYKAYKQSLITETVTKGLNKNISMKDSGIDYLGYIPYNWSVKRLRFMGTLQNGISKSSEYFGFGYPFLSYGDVYKNEVIPKTVVGLVNSSEQDRESYSVKEGDVFFTRTSETIEEVGIASICMENIKDATFAGFIIRFRPMTDELYKGYSKYYFRCEIHRKFFVKEMNLVTRASLSQELLKKLPILIPSVEEQKGIADFLDKKCEAIDSAISKKEQLIEKLEAYKKSLIYECVTGKREVN